MPKPANCNSSRLQRAKGYPYRRPPHSYIYVNGAAHIFPNVQWKGVHHLASLDVDSRSYSFEECHQASAPLISLPALLRSSGWSDAQIHAQLAAERTPILAIGSNAGVEQLTRKYPSDMFPQGVVIPVVEAVLEDFDVVYAPLVSSYGSATASLDHVPGASVQLYITFLDSHQLERMHATEGCYDLVELKGIRLHEACSIRHPWPAHRIDHTALVYIHQRGSLYLPRPGDTSADAARVALDEIGCANRSLPSARQTQMLEQIRTAFAQSRGDMGAAGQGRGLDEWILQCLDEPQYRADLVQFLVENARPIAFPGARVLQTLGDITSESVAEYV